MTSIEPYIPPASVTQLQRLAENAELITQSGEIVAATDADDASLVAWSLVAMELRSIARLMESSASAVLLARCQERAGDVTTEYGTARESISRSSISGIQAQRIRDLLEGFAEDGVIPWEAVDNVAPLQPHVTPAKLANYAEKSPLVVGEQLERLMPEKRRSIKIDPAG